MSRKTGNIAEDCAAVVATIAAELANRHVQTLDVCTEIAFLAGGVRTERADVGFLAHVNRLLVA